MNIPDHINKLYKEWSKLSEEPLPTIQGERFKQERRNLNAYRKFEQACFDSKLNPKKIIHYFIDTAKR